MFYQNARSLYTFSLTFPAFGLNGQTITKTENAAVFSEASYELFDGKVVPLVGLRYFKDRREADSISNGVRVQSKARPDALTWRANLAINPSPDWMLFFNAGTGFRSGILQSQAQADAVIADGVPSDISLTPDKLRNLEVGMKGSLFSGDLRVAVSLYDIKYTNIQSAFNTSIGLAAFANLGDGKAQGIDMELTWRTPLKGFTLNAIGNVNNSKFTRVRPAFAGADPRISNGLRLLNTPTHNFRLDASYEQPIGNATLFATSSATFIGRSRLGDATVNEINPYELYQASIGVRFDRYEVRLFGDNLSDLRGPTSANGPTLLAGPRPRTIGVTFRLNTN
ncbi:TonB-dependent receptor [Novosphingobium sp. THN1]|uniref:TonB-dependent receptor domain-containing protein n=1 Tax=Novosphingobium sp. THN1 TaxID=1016987 RepID=UPI001F078346|nr:TonB-dependent receptor [Novosphingobium sp. THN1]